MEELNQVDVLNNESQDNVINSEEINLDELKAEEREIIAQLQEGKIPDALKAEVDAKMKEYAALFDPEIRTKRAKKLLENKYEANFEIMTYRDQQIASNYFTVNAYNSEEPNLIFEANVGISEDFIDDSYVVRKICQRMAETMEDKVSFFVERYRIYVEATALITVLNNPEIEYTDIQEVIPGNRYRVHLFITPGSDETNITKESLYSLFEGFDLLSGSFNLYNVNLETFKEIETYLDSQPRLYYSFDKLAQKDRVYKCNVTAGKPEFDGEKLDEVINKYFR